MIDQFLLLWLSSHHYDLGYYHGHQLSKCDLLLPQFIPWSHYDHGMITPKKFLPAITLCDHTREHNHIFTGGMLRLT